MTSQRSDADVCQCEKIPGGILEVDDFNKPVHIVCGKPIVSAPYDAKIVVGEKAGPYKVIALGSAWKIDGPGRDRSAHYGHPDAANLLCRSLNKAYAAGLADGKKRRDALRKALEALALCECMMRGDTCPKHLALAQDDAGE